MKPQTITFEHFVPGTALGAHEEPYTQALANAWQAIFGAAQQDTGASGAERASIAVVLSMRAYLNVVSPRPPGNVQARQRFQLHAMPEPGEVVCSEITCTGKQIKRERLHVELQVKGTGAQGRPIYTAVMGLIWAK